ncbi:MAG: riboflavin synthase [Rickettsiales bacterium]
MFTGVVREKGRILSREANGRLFAFFAPNVMASGVRLGDSVSCNGVCLTACAFTENGFFADLVDETLSRTTAGSWREGDSVHLEPALKLGEALDGHMVAGHVDAVAHILSVSPTTNGLDWRVELPEALAPLTAEKGGVCLDGVSLTVTTASRRDFGVSLVPHTLERTNFADKRVGDALNMEADMIARYLYRIHSLRERP